jgi:hypothetical protein
MNQSTRCGLGGKPRQRLRRYSGLTSSWAHSQAPIRMASIARSLRRALSFALLSQPLLLLLFLLHSPARAETITVGPAGQPEALRQAVRDAKDGDVIRLLPGNYKGVSVVIAQKQLTIRSEGERPVFDGNAKGVDGNAVFIVRGGEVRLENIEIRGVRTADATGAGVRLDGGKLTVVKCVFLDNETGLVTGHDQKAELTIESSIFGVAPREVGRLNHLLYVGRIARFSITGSRFFQGFEGHMIVSRARENFIGYNVLRDNTAGGSSYEIDLPLGGAATIIGNVIAQGANGQNPVVISYGSQGKAWDKNSLVLSHNTLISEGWRPAWFLRVYKDRIPGMDEVLAINNITVGTGVFWLGASGHFEGNWPATLGMLTDVVTHAFELPSGSWLKGRAVNPKNVAGRDVAPKFEFEFPVGLRPLRADITSWSPGAFQR